MDRSSNGVGDHMPSTSTSNSTSNSTWEIEEASPIVNPVQPQGLMPGFGCRPDEDVEELYVAVGKSGSSTDALSWALSHVAKRSTLLYLVHVFPEVHHIPTPLGMLPKNQVTPQQVETYMSRERFKRKEMLQKFVNMCHASQVMADTILIESDLIAKAVLDLVPVLNIERLIVGTTKSNPSPNPHKKSKKGSGKAEQIHKGAPNYCEVTIICGGKEVRAPDQTVLSSSTTDTTHNKSKEVNGHGRVNKDSISCICFSRKST